MNVIAGYWQWEWVNMLALVTLPAMVHIQLWEHMFKLNEATIILVYTTVMSSMNVTIWHKQIRHAVMNVTVWCKEIRHAAGNGMWPRQWCTTAFLNCSIVIYHSSIYRQ